MSLFNGGYAIVSANDIDVYSKCLNALANQKPILFYEDANTCYYIDSVSMVGTDVVLTKGGKTITIDSSNNVVSSGEIQNHLYKIYIQGNCVNNDEDIDVYIIANIYTNIKPTITDDLYDSLMNILLENGFTVDNNALNTSSDTIIGIYKYPSQTYISMYMNTDNSYEIIKEDSNINISFIQLF